MATLALALALLAAPQGWQPAESPLLTRWAVGLDPAAPLPEHPRPQLARPRWASLNGLWDYAVRPRAEDRPPRWDGRILVPFAPESALSGVGRRVGPEHRLWYRHRFTVGEDLEGERLLLHFGAVDWRTDAWLNGRHLGRHEGGYDPFTWDLTAALRDGEQELVLAVWDPTDRGTQPRGKQVSDPGGIWYEPVTGIWQTVWLEPVPSTHVAGLTITPDLARGEVRVAAEIGGPREGVRLRVTARDGEVAVARAEGAAGEEVALELEAPRAWSPEDPHLYALDVELLGAGGEVVDAVESYAGLRSIAVQAGDDGVPRLVLNGEPRFQYGLLDQGWWPDGLYTAPADAALRFDVETARRLGFDMLRKHVKVEPARWYHHCDRLGVLVWQDMPNGGRHARWNAAGTFDGTELERDPESAARYRRELRTMVAALRNHPSIVAWVPFNEGWGQFDTVAICAELEAMDGTRIIDCASGGNDFPAGHVRDVHRYPGPGCPPLETTRAAVLGEFGGLGLPVAGHTWVAEESWGYRTFESREALQDAYLRLADRLALLRAEGLAAAVYTQLTDVESEVNGLLTYDRAVLKLDPERLREAHAALRGPPPRLRTLVPTSRREPQAWRWTVQDPGPGWAEPDFDDASWTTGPGGFGTPGTPGAVIGTRWDGPRIWLRRSFELDGAPEGKTHLRVHHDEDAEVWIDGTKVAALSGHTTDYVLVPPDTEPPLGEGRHTLAVRCTQSRGGQFVDVGLVSLRQPR